MKYTIDDLRVLTIAGAAEDTFLRFAPGGQRESGGILLGTVFPNEVLIERITTPTWRDRAARYWFKRNVPAAQKRVTFAWHESGGTQPELSKKIAAARGTSDTVLVRVPALNAYFLGTTTNGTLMLTPIVDIPGTALRAN